MPPKQKGHNLRGKDKLFRNAVEHVHVGVGHTVLGDLSLHLAAGSAKHTRSTVAPPTTVAGAAPSSVEDRPAFYLELNEQLLSHSSKDFKKFRYEVLDLCETRALMDMSHRQIAEKLLLCLLDRSGGAVGSRVKGKAAKTAEGKGETSEGFAAFVRLTIAFARDLGPKFFQYFEVFHQAVHAGLFDRRGYLMPDTARLQLVFSAQAAWCREMAPYWCAPAQRQLVKRALGVYVALLTDGREFVRRLAAELLAYTCRLVHPLLPLIVETISAEVLDDFQRYVLKSHAQNTEATAAVAGEAGGEDMDADDDDDDDAPLALAAQKEPNHAVDEADEAATIAVPVGLTAAEIWTVSQTVQYTKEVLPNHPVTESLGLFAAELMRGIRGALSSSFEYFYLSLLETGLLLTASQKADVLSREEVFMAAFGYNRTEEALQAEDHKHDAEANMEVHAGRYASVFGHGGGTSHVADEDDAAARAGGAVGRPADVLDSATVPLAQELVRALMSEALQASVQAVLREVRANSSQHAHSDSADDDDDLEDEELDEPAESASALTAIDSGVGGYQRASTRLLHAAKATLAVGNVHHIHILRALLNSSYYYLWQDARELSVLRAIAEKLLTHLKASASEPKTTHTAAVALSSSTSSVAFHAALLELLVPLCLTPYLCHPMALRTGVAQAAAAHANDTHTVAVQKAFLPLGREVVQQLLRQASSASAADADQADLVEAARVTLYAFAQDILQKQFAFCLAEERRAAEETADDEAHHHSGHARTAQEGEDDYEDDYVPDDQDKDGTLGSFTSGRLMDVQRRQAAARRASDAQASRARRAEAVLTIKPLLTPLALTLLHALCTGYWSLANADLDVRLALAQAGTVTPEADVGTLLAARHVERAVLLVRLTHDRTRHLASSPLQQLLRLKSTTSASSATAAGLALRECVEMMFTRLMGLFVQRAGQVLDRAAALTGSVSLARPAEQGLVNVATCFRNEMELLSCCLPVLRDLLVRTPPAASAATSADAVTVAPPHAHTRLEAPLQQVLEAVRRWMALRAATVEPSTLTLLVPPSSGYALYAQVVSVLIHTAPSTRDVGGAPAKSASSRRSRAARPTASAFDHLAQTIRLLAAAFASSNPRRTTASTSSTSSAVATPARLLSESERGQLLYATQVLLRSLLWSLGLPEDAHTAGKRLSEDTRLAMHTLHEALPVDCQVCLVQSILLESLVSPMQSLRLLTLRLLVWLCHSDLPESDRLAGLSPVDTELLLALVRAEEFNPLSATGNLDGLKQVLAKATFAAESGAMTDPFTRSLLARAMMGLYYLKFSGAWEIATRILHGLVRHEQTTPTSVYIKSRMDSDEDDEETHEGADVDGQTTSTTSGTVATTTSTRRRRRLEPVVWDTVIAPYAHLMVFGDVMALESRAAAAEAADLARLDTKDGDGEEDDVEADVEAHMPSARVLWQARLDAWTTYRCPYALTLTDQQQHEKGAMVSRAFSSLQYTDDVVTAVDLAGEDAELISWQSHWVDQLQRANASGYLARSTDRVTLAQTFLGALEEMMKHSSAFDSKLRLVEDLVLELVAMDRNEHPLTAGVAQLKKLDERLSLAMRACAVAPTTVLSTGQQQRAEASALATLVSRNEVLQSVFASYTAHTSAKLQRAALDNLKRLRVEPFNLYHDQLSPYCDSMKNLFAFLSSFHLDTIPVHNRADYVATAIAICLPKLIAKASKDKRRDQAVLQRRLMSFLTELAAHSTAPSAKGRAGAMEEVDEVRHVLDRVTQRLVLSRVSTSDELTDVAAFDFLEQWRTVVRDARDRHAVRHLERQARQLTHATRLLQSLLGAVGQRFASYVRSCLYLALQAYLVACRQNLRAAVDARLDADREDAAEEEVVRVQRWCEETQRALRSRAVSLALAELRRTAVTVVALLLEQFPSEAMAVIEEMVAQASGEAEEAVRAVRASIFGRYIAALYANAKGITQPQAEVGARVGAGKTIARGTVTPMLRLVLAWSSREPLLPLVAAFGDEVTGTFADLFAVNPLYLEAHHATSHAKLAGRGQRAAMPAVHKAPAPAVYEALRCLTDLLTRREETVRVLGQTPPSPSSVPSPSGKRGRHTASRSKAGTVVTLHEAFLAAHVTPVFTALYKLIMHGDDEDDDNTPISRRVEDGVAQDQAAAKRTGGATRFSVMAFSVPMWKEVIRTVSMLAQQMQHRALPTGEEEAGHTSAEAQEVQRMLGRLLEVSLKFVVHPICVTDAGTVVMAMQVVHQLLAHLACVDPVRHYRPLVHLFNTVTNPEARLLLCATMKGVVPKMPLTRVVGCTSTDEAAVQDALTAQMAAAARAVACLNSFADNNEAHDLYDFDLRYHTFHSLQQFFANKGNYGALHGAAATASANATTSGAASAAAPRQARDAVRHERDYSGELDVRLPVSKHTAPVLAVPAFQLLAANVMYFLRDPASTLRAQAVQLFYAMMRYAAAGGEAYATLVLEQVVRQGEVLSTLRHGVVSRDVHIRNGHMNCFGALGRYYPTSFASFHTLCSTNTAQDFFQNVGHVQHKCRLHALTLLRKLGSQLQLRDVLRVLVPFLMSAIKDFAQGKRDLQNLTEGRAKGYCDAVLLTIASLTEKMPWEAYYRVLTLFLSNAGANASLRMPMLRGVVQVLENFHFLDADEGAERIEAKTQEAAEKKVNEEDGDDNEDDDDEDELQDDDETVRAEVARRRHEFRHQRVRHVLEQDVLPQLFSFIGSGKEGQKTLGLTGELKGSNINTVSSVRKEQEAEDKATTKHAILQLPVALAVTRIVKHFPEDRFNFYVDHLMDELVRKLRTKNDRHRDSARRILGAMLQETGPGKLRPIITKLQDNLVHGYQLHVLGYTVVTLLFQLYEPQSATAGRLHAGAGGTQDRHHRAHHADPVAEALEEAKKRRLEQHKSATETRPGHATDSDAEEDASEDGAKEAKKGTSAKTAALSEADKADVAVELAEQELIDQLMPHTTEFDHEYGVMCLTNLLDQLITIFLDDYLGEVSAQKEQVELMSKMVEIKSSRAVQGFAFLARHAEATRMMDVFLQKVAWVLTPPSDNSVDAASLHGSAKVKALMMHELRTKYVTVSKNAGADLVFVNKVRLIAVRVARGLMMNPSMRVEQSFEQVRDLLARHNATREAKIQAFEAKDGTRRIRGNAHLLIHKADRATLKAQRDKNFVVEAVPERVDVDFSAHTVLATQQRQKLRLYKGRYGKDLKEAAKDFYREDPATAVVLDTMDEFLLKYLLSVLKQVLGIGKAHRHSKAAVQLDLLRHQQEHKAATQDDEVGAADEEEPGVEVEDDPEEAAAAAEEQEEEEEEEEGEEEEDDASDGEEMAALDPQNLDADGDDDLDNFAEAQAHDGASAQAAPSAPSRRKKDRSTAALLARHNLSAAFTREHRQLLESLVPVVLHTLQGEGSDPVVGNALDCLLALVSLRPPLEAVHDMDATLLDTVAGFLMRGGAIKQRSMRVCAALICHQKFELTEPQAVQLIALARSEIVDRSEFLPMALSLFHAVLRKHVHVVEVYDLVDLVTELLVHLGAKSGIRYRCVQILVRFLTEFKLTPEKFRSHINLYCRNLDYPELAGILALLELLDALAYRLPTVVLRDEAPVLLPPLAAVVLRGQWRDARERAGQVIQHLVKLAGIDVLVPLLSSWMDPAKPRPTREMAAQLWATMIPAVATAYGLHDPAVANTFPADETDAEWQSLREARDGFDQCCAWSLQAVLNGCLYNQYEAAGGKKVASGSTLNAKFKAKAEMKGWEQIFYNLRCAEALFVASPFRMYQRLGPALLPVLVDHLMLHTHPWVQAASVRILRHYCYTLVESHSGYLAVEADTFVVSCDLAASTHTDASAKAVEEEEAEEAEAGTAVMFLVVPPVGAASVAQLETALRQAARLLKHCLTRVAMSDVSNETYNAHRAINSPARAELLKLMVYLLRAVCVLSVRLQLLASSPSADLTASARQHVQALVERELRLVRRQLEGVAKPVLKQERVVNYMVRTATLVQLFGGLVSVLPLSAVASAEENGADAEEEERMTASPEDMAEQAARRCAVDDAARGLVGPSGLDVLRLVQSVAAPLVGMALRAGGISDRLATLANQSASVIAQQLEARRPLLRKRRLPAATTTTTTTTSHKRARDDDTAVETAASAEGAKKRRKETRAADAPVAETATAVVAVTPSLDVVLGELTTHLATIRQERRVKQITHETHKTMKRNRREMDRNGSF